MATTMSFMQLNLILSLVLFALSVTIPFFVVLSAKQKFKVGDITELFLQYALFFNVGCLFLTGFMGQLMYAHEIANLLCWSWSPFQYELACSELGLAVLGLISPLFHREFWLATIIAAVIWFTGGSAVHLYYLVRCGNKEISNAAFVIGWNIFIAVWLLALYGLLALVKNEKDSYENLSRER
jgi:hypothetical protein